MTKCSTGLVFDSFSENIPNWHLYGEGDLLLKNIIDFCKSNRDEDGWVQIDESKLSFVDRRTRAKIINYIHSNLENDLNDDSFELF